MGDQIASLYIVCDDELTIIPKKLTIENESGTEMSWGHTAAEGVVARDAKSGALVTRVAMLLMHDIKELIIAHPSSEPSIVEGWWIMGPTPLALMMHQMKKVIPAVGATIAFRVKRCRLTCSSLLVPGLVLYSPRNKLTFGGWETISQVKR
jgi:hypothetical protein